MSIYDWPEHERPREKLLKQGAEALSDAELLAIFLRTGVAGKNAVELSRDLISTFSGLRPLLESSRTEFCAARGLGTAKYVQLQAVLEMSKRYLAESLERSSALESPESVRAYLSSSLRHENREVFACLFLDNQHRLICFERMFFGTINEASVYPREVVRRALDHNAAALILAHNHPSGVAEPSVADQQITGRLVEALRLIDVRVLDHMIVGDGAVASFAERGLL